MRTRVSRSSRFAPARTHAKIPHMKKTSIHSELHWRGDDENTLNACLKAMTSRCPDHSVSHWNEDELDASRALREVSSRSQTNVLLSSSALALWRAVALTYQ